MKRFTSLIVGCFLIGGWSQPGIAAAAEASKGSKIVVQVSALRSAKGALIIHLFSGKGEGFPGDGEKATRTELLELKAKEAKMEFTGLAPGPYAVAVCHDENGNGKCDTNLLGIPTEGIGASNGVRGRFGPPRYKDAKVDLGATEKTVKITLDY